MRKVITIGGVFLLIGCIVFIMSFLGSQNIVEAQPPQIATPEPPVVQVVFGMLTLEPRQEFVGTLFKPNKGSQKVTLMCYETITGEEIEDLSATYTVAEGAGVYDTFTNPKDEEVSIVCTMETLVNDQGIHPGRALYASMGLKTSTCGVIPARVGSILDEPLTVRTLNCD